MVTIEDVLALRNAKVRIEFADGVVVAAEIVDVQGDQDHDQVGFKFLEFLAPLDRSSTMQPGNFYAADLDQIHKVERG